MADEERQQAGGAGPDGESGSAGGQMSEEELRAELERQFRRQRVPDLIKQYMVSLSTLAYVKMGVAEEDREVKDLEQARLAIDSFKALLDSVGERLESQDRQALAGALASMQITFAKVAEGGGEAAGATQAGEGERQTSSGAAETGGKGEKAGSKGAASRLWVPGRE